VFNMGCRLEIYTNENTVGQLINIANEYGIDAQVIGRVEEGNKELEIVIGEKRINYNFGNE
ncbi:MAG TPA: hypothetical protein VJ499_11060, partial [Flavisolibacter sp.]|nr:hypothetical protein [Flavisolibacter sp.]